MNIFFNDSIRFTRTGADWTAYTRQANFNAWVPGVRFKSPADSGPNLLYAAWLAAWSPLTDLRAIAPRRVSL